MLNATIPLNKSQVIDCVAAYLHASGLVSDDFEITDIQGLFKDDKDYVTVALKQEREVTTRIHNA